MLTGSAFWTGGKRNVQGLYSRLWGSGFLPSQHQGVALQTHGDPVLFLSNPNGIVESERDEFNRQMDREFRYIRDFIILHYHVTERTDSEFWRRCRDMDIPDSLRNRIDLFRDTGGVFEAEFDIFRENSWNQVMLGQGLEPQDLRKIGAFIDTLPAPQPPLAANEASVARGAAIFCGAAGTW